MEQLIPYKRSFREAIAILQPSATENIIQQCFADLVVFYSQENRKYHTLEHIKSCFVQLAKYSRENPLSDKEVSLLTLAIWYHDSIYDTQSTANEEDSAKLFKNHGKLLGIPAKDVKEVSGIILDTKTHETSSPLSELFLDIDLSILGASISDFKTYEYNVRLEYSWVPEKEFVRERKKIIAKLAKRKRIFKTQFFFDALEKQAKKNLAAYIKK